MVIEVSNAGFLGSATMTAATEVWSATSSWYQCHFQNIRVRGVKVVAIAVTETNNSRRCCRSRNDGGAATNRSTKRNAGN
jgi:hypothetical protein